MATFSRAVSFPLASNASKAGTSNALAKADDQEGWLKAGKFIRAILLLPRNASTTKQLKNIVKMGGSSDVKDDENNNIPKDEKLEKPEKQSHKNLQTKNIQKITRNDLINGTYDLSPKPVRRSTTGSTNERTLSKRRQNNRRRTSGSRSTRTNTSSSSSPNSSRSRTPAINISQIDDVVQGSEKNELFISAQAQIRKDKLLKSKRSSDPEVIKSHSHHTNDGMLTVPVQRSITLDSDISDYYST